MSSQTPPRSSMPRRNNRQHLRGKKTARGSSQGCRKGSRLWSSTTQKGRTSYARWDCRRIWERYFGSMRTNTSLLRLCDAIVALKTLKTSSMALSRTHSGRISLRIWLVCLIDSMMLMNSKKIISTLLRFGGQPASLKTLRLFSMVGSASVWSCPDGQ